MTATAGAPSGIRTGERSSAHDGHAHDTEVVRTDGWFRCHEIASALWCVLHHEVASDEVASEGQPIHRTNAIDAGHVRESFQNSSVKRVHLCGRRIFALRQIHAERQDVLRFEAGVDRGQPQKALHQQPSAGQQHDDERDLGDDSPRMSRVCAVCVRGAITERSARIDPCRVERRCNAEDDAGADRQHECEEQHRDVEMHVSDAGQSTRGDQCEQYTHPGCRQHEPADATQRASTPLSVSSCRISRRRLEPSDMRTATSFWRAIARAASRLATFAHAINSTNSTAPRKTRINGGLLQPRRHGEARAERPARATRPSNCFHCRTASCTHVGMCLLEAPHRL